MKDRAGLCEVWQTLQNHNQETDLPHNAFPENFHPDFYHNTDISETLHVWDMQLVTYGKQIIERRKEFVDQLNEIIYGIHKNLSGDREELVIVYEHPDRTSQR